MVTRNEAVDLGLTKYCTGLPCRNGHLSQRYTSTGGCIECLRMPQIKMKKVLKSARDERRHTMPIDVFAPVNRHFIVAEFGRIFRKNTAPYGDSLETLITLAAKMNDDQLAALVTCAALVA